MKRLPLFLLFLIVLSILLSPLPVLAEKPILTIDTGGHTSGIRDVVFTSNGRHLVSASYDKTIRVWDVSTGEMVRVLRGQIAAGKEGTIYAIAISPDDRVVAVGGWMGPTKNYKRIR